MENGLIETIKTPTASPTFGKDGSFYVDKPVGSMSISPCGRDVVLASRQGLHIVDLDSPWAPPRHLPHLTPWEVADVQWSPFASRDYWVVSTSNQKALVWNLAMSSPRASIEHVLHAHSRAITDINFSAHHPDVLATCAVDSFVHCWDLRHPARPALTFCDWFAGATQVKWNRQDPHIIASSHDKMLRIWDDRKGSYALRSIEAHDTKIYGVDWNRTEARELVTCSLDKTIKFWDYSDENNEPKHVIKTPFPVWRARHTPFGSGLLAMPQRGDNNVYMYDHRQNDDISPGSSISPIKQFEGHEDQVKEFLWRPRGTVETQVDHREFQLVTWGSDRTLRLHKIEDAELEEVGYYRGETLHNKVNFSRKNAQYKTFREDPGKASGLNAKASTGNQSFLDAGSGMDMHRASVGTMIPSPSTADSGWMGGGFVNSRPGMRGKNGQRKDVDPISWMKGVKIGKREGPLTQSTLSVVSPHFRVDRSHEEFDSLGDEITHVGTKFSKVDFTHIDVENRFVKLSLHGPWGPKDTLTYLDCRLDFPKGYPKHSAPVLSVEITTSLDRAMIASLRVDVKAIGDAFQACQRSSLEPLIRYLQGERALDDILAWTRDDPETSVFEFGEPNDGSSSDDEDDTVPYTGIQNGEFGLSGSGILSASNANTNVPLARTCGATWSWDGRLVCFFQPKQEKESSLVGSLGLEGPALLMRGNKRRMFEGFGKFHRHTSTKSKTSSTATVDSEISDSGSNSDISDSSSSGSSASSKDNTSKDQYLGPQHAFHTDVFHNMRLDRVADEAQRSALSGGSVSHHRRDSHKSVVVLRNFRDLLPSKPTLALDYKISGTDACQHNAEAARKHGHDELAHIWALLDILLKENVPTQTLLLQGSEAFLENLLISGLNGGYGDNDIAEARPKMGESTGSVKWGQHPFGRSNLIKTLFHYFAQIADVQMLAMMSCMFCEPYIETQSNIGHLTPKISGTNNRIYPTPLSSPFGSTPVHTDYFPSIEVATNAVIGEGSNPTNDEELRAPGSPGPTPLSPLSNDPVAQSSIRAILPSSLKSDSNFERTELADKTLSSSPERFRWSQRSTSNLATSLASSLPRPFSFGASVSSSPPGVYSKARTSPSSGSGPSQTQHTPWSASSFFNKAMNSTGGIRSRDMSLVVGEINTGARRSQAGVSKMEVSLKNQSQFHNDRYAEYPPFDEDEWLLYKSYRQSYATLLWTWGHHIDTTEMLKFNGTEFFSLDAPLHQITEKSKSLMIGRKQLATNNALSEGGLLYLDRVCSHCEKLHGPGLSTFGSKCPSCQVKAPHLACALCDELVRGLAMPCLACGHILHHECRFLMNQSLVLQQHCASGCGCACVEHSQVEMLWLPEYDTRPHSSSPSTIRELDERNQDDFAESPHNWEDVAYESLAKNLATNLAEPAKVKATTPVRPKDWSASNSWH